MPRLPHPSFWLDLAGKLGPPVFAATLVACLLARHFEPLHGVLMALGMLLIGLNHWGTRRPPGGDGGAP